MSEGEARSTTKTDAHTPRPRRRIRLWKVAACLVAAPVVGLAVAEGILRFGMGLGDPPLYELDQDVEYMLVPSRTYHRFGNTYSVNSFSMRSPEIAPTRTDPRELRVLIIGDSIVNGGGKIDQKDVCSEVLRNLLVERLKRPVVVGNASAGSWGPPNELAYAKLYGLFNADVVVQVLNSADADDVPGLESIGPQWPQHKPVLALQEVAEKFAPRLVERLTGRTLFPPPKRIANPSVDRAECLQAVRELAAMVRASGATYVMLQYQIKPEINGPRPSGDAALAALAAEISAPRFESAAKFAALQARGVDPFLAGDTVHCSKDGQRALGELMADEIAGLVDETTSAEQKPTDGGGKTRSP